MNTGGIRTLLVATALLLVGSPSLAASVATEDCAFYRLLYESKLTPGEKFDLAQDAKAAFHRRSYQSGEPRLTVLGVSAQKREKILNSLSKALEDFYRNRFRQALPGEIASPLAGGNESHMKDHLALVEAFGPDYEREFGIDPLSLRVITQAHDLGKAVLDEGLKSEIDRRLDAARSNGVLNTQPGIDFVRRAVMPHDDHTIVLGLPAVVRDIADRYGLTEEQSTDLLSQLVYHTVGHNFGPASVDSAFGKDASLAFLEARYPELTLKEREAINNAFWVRFYQHGIQAPDGTVLVSPFARDVGMVEQTPRPRSSLGHALALNDRIALVTDGAMEKIPLQNLNRTGFNAELVRQTFTSGGDAIGPTTAALVKAEYAELDFISEGQRSGGAKDFGPVAYGLQVAHEASAFGKRLLKSNSEKALARWKISPEEAQHVLVYEGKVDRYKIDGGSFKVDPVTGARSWVSSDRPKLFVWRGGQWIETNEFPAGTTSGAAKPNGWQLLLDLARQDGFRITSPKTFAERHSPVGLSF